MKNLVRLAALSTLAVTIASPLSAQRRDWPPQHRRERPAVSIEAAGLFSSLKGSALGAVGDGAGFDVMGSIGSGMFSIGGGYQRQSHSRSLGGDAVVSGGFIEPRIATPFAVGNFTPYVFGRAARLSRRVSASDFEPNVSGTALGGGVGTLFWIAPGIQLNTAIYWQNLEFERPSVVEPAILQSRAEGSQWALRAGLSVGFDTWGR